MIQEGAIIDARKKNKNRSLSQNRYLHLLIGWYAIETGYSMEEVKVDIFKRLCNRDIFIRQRPNRFGVIIDYLRSSNDLDTAEMTTAIGRFRNYAASMGIYLPEPDEQEHLLVIEQQMERNKTYL